MVSGNGSVISEDKTDYQSCPQGINIRFKAELNISALPAPKTIPIGLVFEIGSHSIALSDLEFIDYKCLPPFPVGLFTLGLLQT